MPALVLFFMFLLLPVAEIYVIIQVGGVIGALPTALLLLAESLLGAVIVRREGRRAWRTLRETFERGGLPDRELADAALVLVGGTLLLTPGFITDVAGFLCVLPFTRPLVRRMLVSYARHRVDVLERMVARRPGGVFGAVRPEAPYEGSPGRGDAGSAGPVIRGEVVREGSPGGTDDR